MNNTIFIFIWIFLNLIFGFIIIGVSLISLGVLMIPLIILLIIFNIIMVLYFYNLLDENSECCSIYN